MNTLLFTHANAGHLPPILFDEKEIVAGPLYNNLRLEGGNRYLHTPTGVFDSACATDMLSSQEQPDLVLVHADSTYRCLPRNLPQSANKCLLIGGCTHILNQPIQGLINYAASEHFDAIVLWNRQHAHFFTEWGFKNVHWLPGLCFEAAQHPLELPRRVPIGFYGQTGSLHPRRPLLLKALAEAGMPATGGFQPRKESMELLAQSQISLNISLNGELNLRVFESTRNGTFLLTDRISHYAGLEALYPEDQACATYTDTNELIEKARHYSSHTEARLAIAQRGQTTTETIFSRKARRQTLLNLVENRQCDALFDLKHEPRCHIQANPETRPTLKRRIQIYEYIQELHRTKEQTLIQHSPHCLPFIASDLADLARLQQVALMAEDAYHKKYDAFLRALRIPNLRCTGSDKSTESIADLLIISQAEATDYSAFCHNTPKSILIWDYTNGISVDSTLQKFGYAQTKTETSLSGLFNSSN